MCTRVWLCGGGCVGLLLCVAAATAQEKPDGAKGAYDPAAEMQKWMELSKPSAEHQTLKPMLGEWKTTVRHWMQPGQEPLVSTGKSKNALVLGGRFMHTEYKGGFMDMPFEGIGYTGYDRLQKKYVSVWMDSMGTQVAMDTGTYDADSKTFTYHGEMQMPNGGKFESKTVIKILGPDKHEMTMYHRMPGMEDMAKVMHITYERVGEASAHAD